MKRVSVLLLFSGLLTTSAFSQQQPPPPPPQPPAATQPSTATPPSTPSQSQDSGQNGTQPNLPSQQQSSPQTTNQQQSTGQSTEAQPNLPPQQQPSAQTPGQPQNAGQNTGTQPNLPPQQQSCPQPVNQQQYCSAQQQANNLPQADRDAAEEISEIRAKDEDRLKESKAVLKELLGGPAHISNSLLEQSKCVIIIPSVKKFAWALGVKYGRGVMTCRLGENFNGPWSAPSMYALEGGNFGLQIGLQATDLVLLIMNDRGVDSLLGSKVKLGGDASVAAGPIGRSMEASTDLAMRAKILAYSRAHGIFAGVALDGSTLRPDERANEALYGHDIRPREIVRSGDVHMPPDARPLIQLLEQSVRAASEGNPPAPGQQR